MRINKSKNRPGATNTEAAIGAQGATNTIGQYSYPPITIGAFCAFMIADLSRKGK